MKREYEAESVKWEKKVEKRPTEKREGKKSNRRTHAVYYIRDDDELYKNK